MSRSILLVLSEEKGNDFMGCLLVKALLEPEFAGIIFKHGFKHYSFSFVKQFHIARISRLDISPKLCIELQIFVCNFQSCILDILNLIFVFAIRIKR